MSRVIDIDVLPWEIVALIVYAETLLEPLLSTYANLPVGSTVTE